MITATELLGTLAFLILAGIVMIIETAVSSLGALKTKHLSENTTTISPALELWQKRPSRILLTLHLYKYFLLFAAAGLLTISWKSIADSTQNLIAAFALTIGTLIFAEILPKAIAKTYSDSLAMPCLKLSVILYRLSYPLIWPLARFGAGLGKIFAGGQALQKPITEEELEFLISLGKSAGIIEDLKKEMISGVFEFDETKVREIMTPRTDIISIERNTNIRDALKLILDSGHSRIPVYEKRIDNIVGLIFAKDFLRLVNPEAIPPDTKVSSLMRDPFFTPESKPLIDVFKDLKRTKNHMAIVIDEYGGTAGIVTMEDILEEIVGEIQDEYDVEEAKILEIDKGIYDVAGSVNISEFSEHFLLDSELLDTAGQDVDTIAGWMTQQLVVMPKIGQSLKVGPLTIEVSSIGRHRIERLRVTTEPPKSDVSEVPVTGVTTN